MIPSHLCAVHARVDSAGLSQIDKYTEEDPSKLYVPSDTQAEKDEGKIQASFGLSGRVASVYGVTSPEGGNVLTTDNVLTVRAPPPVPTHIGFDLCHNDRVLCACPVRQAHLLL